MRLALSPIQKLEHAAERIGRGDVHARAEPSPLADRTLASLTRTFNQALGGLEASRTRERRLAAYVLGAQERERDRLARELYGGAAQTLAGVLVRLRVAARRDGPDSTALTEIRDEVARDLEEIRAVARRLRPPELDELGVLPALEAHARGATDGRAPRVRFHGRVAEERLDRAGRLVLFRIAQEALSNAATYAGASTVDVAFHPAADGLRLEVADDGARFDASGRMADPGGRVGLLTMLGLAANAGGSLRVASSSGAGTVVRAVLPWTKHPTRPARAATDDHDEGGYDVRPDPRAAGRLHVR